MRVAASAPVSKVCGIAALLADGYFRAGGIHSCRQVGSDNVAKIADFGISKFVQGSSQRLQEQVSAYASRLMFSLC